MSWSLGTLRFRRRTLDWSRVYIAGVVNVTPDSFSDGGLYSETEAAVARGRAVIAAGADIVDVGGESTRPGALAVDAAVEIERVVPVIRALAGAVVAGRHAVISVDTTKAAVARAAIAAGAEIVNDVSGGLFDPDIVAATEAGGAAYICGHVRGADLAAVHAAENDPPDYEAVAFELAARVAALPVALRHRTIVDPGLGFGKKGDENLELIRWSGELGRAARRPVLIGPSRKRFVRAICGAGSGGDTVPSAALDAGTVGACLAAAGCGANVVRVHNVELLKPAMMVYEAIVGTAS